MNNKIKSLPVERDEHGYWIHPGYEKFCNGREYISDAEFNDWMSENCLECRTEYCDEDEIDHNADGYDISPWQPSGIKGEGWFIGSIHNTEDGPECLWFRNVEGGAV